MCKNIKKIIKYIFFVIDVEFNLKSEDLADTTFNLNNGTYKPYKEPSVLLSFINKSSYYPQQIINHLSKTINESLFRSSSSQEVFNSSKLPYEKALRDGGYIDFDLKFNKTSIYKTKRKWQRNIVWFNANFRRIVSKNITKRFL